MDLLSSDSSSYSDEETGEPSSSDSNNVSINSVTLVSCSDDDAAHALLVRSQPHVRGNWAGHVFVPTNISTREQNSIWKHLSQSLSNAAYKGSVLVHDDDVWHVSLSRSFYLQLGSIDSFVKAVKNRMQFESAFSIAASSTDSFCLLRNDDNTRTFVVLSIPAHPTLLRLVQHINAVLSDYRQPLYDYDPLCFHVSIATVPPETQSQLDDIKVLPVTRGGTIHMPLIRVSAIHLSFGGGAKQYVIPLQET